MLGGKPIIRGHRLAVEHVLGMLAAGDAVDDLLREYPWLERDDVQACLVYAKRLVAHERVEPAVESPQLTDDDRAALHRALELSMQQAKAGSVTPASEIVDEIRRRR